MLIGEYQHSVDAKGRMIMPAKFREDLGEHFIITRGLDNCLFVYSLEEWEEIAKKLKTLPMSQARDIQRFFFSGACEVETDNQGRILIPANLREYANLSRDVVIAGSYSKVEIWDKQNWQEANSHITSEKAARIMDELGI